MAFRFLIDSLYNNIVPPSLIHPNSNYYMFKSGIKPAWEDQANSKGGKWAVQLPRGKYTDAIDSLWLYTVSQTRDSLLLVATRRSIQSEL